MAHSNSTDNPLNSKQSQASPQSSLGQVGKALLKFLSPVRKNPPHAVAQTGLEGAIVTKQPTKSEAQAAAAQEAAVQVKVEAAQQQQAATRPVTPGAEGSGVIKIARDPSTPWVSVVMNVMQSCEKSSANTRTTLANNAYSQARDGKAETRRKTLGRMVDLTTVDNDLEALLAMGFKKDDDEKKAA